MKIIVSGSSGLIGSALTDYLIKQKHTVIKAVRRQPNSECEIRWDPQDGIMNAALINNCDAFVHLAGENIASSRWTASKKTQLQNSRVAATKLLCKQLSKLQNPPRKFLCASAIGYYGDSGDKLIDESGKSGNNFLSALCVDWEKATELSKEAGIKVTNLRIGMVLSAKGGALAKMLPPFQMGMGGCIGSGKQYMSWIDLDDVVRSIEYMICKTDIIGPVNVVAPNPVTNFEFTKALGKTLCRPTIFPVPEFGARLLFGQMADELLLANTRVEPTKLLSNGYSFLYPTVESSLNHIFKNDT